ncbi:hypothetical protein Cyast_0267 [Cyanobacterium stanieri PCC 7202]|uniref:Uncharacterized protein n=1 Tax=Cyanobacterium stanieri (strain ATCC 29140 / PCC 7202) TaxID=292563 RepID=K9YIE8_CYASC|nr:hypothetical protein Cyast_0267 [Cyanobacterium stanieri PCC 7202]
MSSEPLNNILPENENSLNNYLQLIYIGLLSLNIETKLSVLPQNQTDLNFVITSVIKIVKKNDELIHRAVSLWEQIENSDDKNNYYGIVRDYLDNFNKITADSDKFTVNLGQKDIFTVALKILTDLLFYSSISGERLLRDKLELLFKENITPVEDDEI